MKKIILTLISGMCLTLASFDGIAQNALAGYEWLEGTWKGSDIAEFVVKITPSYYQCASEMWDEDMDLTQKEKISFFINLVHDDFIGDVKAICHANDSTARYFYLDEKSKSIYWLYDFDMEIYLKKEMTEDGTQADDQTVEVEPVPFQLVEEKPSFQGGDSNQFSKWVNSNLVYPEIARQNNIQGRVVVQFTITADGSVTDVKALRGVDPSLDEEAVRIVSQSPAWEPGKKAGQAVPVIYNFPVIFRL